MRKATFSATFWRFVGDAKSKSCENIWHLVSRASLDTYEYLLNILIQILENFLKKLLIRVSGRIRPSDSSKWLGFVF